MFIGYDKGKARPEALVLADSKILGHAENNLFERSTSIY
jgi:hypothetical protein